MTKLEAVRELDQHGSDMRFIANVFLTSGGPNGAKMLKKLVDLTRRGISICTQSFTMPYEGLLVDGDSKTPTEILTM